MKLSLSLVTLLLAIAITSLTVRSLFTQQNASEKWMYCTGGSCYTQMNNNYEGDEDDCALYPPVRIPYVEIDAPETVPFADWQPNACAGVYTTLTSGVDRDETPICGCTR